MQGISRATVTDLPKHAGAVALNGDVAQECLDVALDNGPRDRRIVA
jgi:hypothetical protein